MAQFSNHLKILLTKPTTRIQEAKLVERPRHVRRSVRKREVGVVQASQPHFTTFLAFITLQR